MKKSSRLSLSNAIAIMMLVVVLLQTAGFIVNCGFQWDILMMFLFLIVLLVLMIFTKNND